MKKHLLLYSILCTCLQIHAQFGTQQIITTEAAGARSVYAVDLDGDGDMDVLVASKGNNPDDGKVVWFENLDGLGDFSTQHIITNLTQGPLSVFAIDLDGDDDLDVLSASFTDNKVAWYENLDGQGAFGPQLIISNTAISVRDVYAADIDGDGDKDVLAASSGTQEIIWFKNIDGQGTFSNKLIISNNAPGVNTVYATDLDGDGAIDVLSRKGGVDEAVIWFKNIDGQGTFGEEQIVSLNVNSVRQVYAADPDNDGDMDVFSASAGDNKIAWYENTDEQGSFGIQQIISTEAEGARSVFVADLDGDGFKDAMSASIIDSKIAWYKNLTPLGVDEFSNESFVILPIPVSDYLTINNTSSIQIKVIKIYDVIGRLVLQESEQFKTINVSHLNSGILFVKLETEQGIVTKKVIKD